MAALAASSLQPEALLVKVPLRVRLLARCVIQHGGGGAVRGNGGCRIHLPPVLVLPPNVEGTARASMRANSASHAAAQE